MMMWQTMKWVRFDKYCNLCKYADLDQAKDPCNECLETEFNDGSEKPVYYEEKKESKR